MAASDGDIRLVFWVAAIPGFLSFALIVFAVRDPEPSRDADGRPSLRFAEMATLPAAFWWVTGLATVFTLARFSDAFLILRAQSIGLSLLLVPLIMVVMNVAYALSAYPVGVLADRFDRRITLATGLVLLVGADLVLGLTGSAVGLWIGAVLWGLHMASPRGSSPPWSPTPHHRLCAAPPSVSSIW